MEIVKDGREWLIVEYRRNDYGKVVSSEKRIPEENVGIVWDLLLKHVKPGETITCRRLAELLGYPNWALLFGNRSTYFSVYYLPVKVLQHLGFVVYSKSGEITRLDATSQEKRY